MDGIRYGSYYERNIRACQHREGPMSETYEKWMDTYLTAMKTGEEEYKILERLGVSEERVGLAESSNLSFKNALALLRQGIGSTMLSPQSLERVLRTQASDEHVAAYFGMSLEVFLQKINANQLLKQIHGTGRIKGLVDIRAAQLDVALAGSEAMLKHLGVAYLDQDSSRQKIDVTERKDISDREFARRLIALEEMRKYRATIDLTPTEVIVHNDGEIIQQ